MLSFQQTGELLECDDDRKLYSQQINTLNLINDGFIEGKILINKRVFQTAQLVAALQKSINLEGKFLLNCRNSRENLLFFNLG